MRKEFVVIKKFGKYKVGAIVNPIGLVRSSMIKRRLIVPREVAPEIMSEEVPDEVVESEPIEDDSEVIDDIDEDDEDSPLVETAVAPQAHTAEFQPRRGRGRPRRV